MVRQLTRIFGRVSVEHVVSGPGLVNIYQFTHQSFGSGPMITPSSIAPARLCVGVGVVPITPSFRHGSAAPHSSAAAFIA